MTELCFRPGGLELLELDITTDEPGQGPRRRRLEAAARLATAAQLVDRHGGALPFYRHRADRVPVEAITGGAGRRLGHPDAAWWGHLLDARREVHGVALCR